MSKEKFLTPDEAVALLKDEYNVDISTDTIRKWCRSEKLSCKKLGPRKWLIPESEVRKLLE